MPIGKEMIWVFLVNTQIPRGCHLWGFALCFVVAIFVKPFANIMASYTCSDGDKKWYEKIHVNTPFLLPEWVRQHMHYTILSVHEKIMIIDFLAYLTYAIMPIGKVKSDFYKSAKPPRVRTSWGFLFHFLQGGLSPRLIAFLIISIQPFANIVGNYTCHNRNDKC